MFNYVKIEIFKNSKRKIFWIYTILFSIVGCIAVYMSKIKGYIKTIDFKEIHKYLINVGGLTSMLLAIILIFVLLIISSEYKDNTLKNVVSSGLSRSKIVFSKFIVTVMIFGITNSIIWIVIITYCIFVLPVINFSFSILMSFMIKFMVFAILWVAAIAVGTFLAFIIKSQLIVSIIYVIIFYIGDSLIGILNILNIFIPNTNIDFGDLKVFFIQYNLKNISNFTYQNEFIFSTVLGIAYIIIFVFLATVCFKRKDV